MAYKINDDCTACGSCIGECPVDAISEGDIYKIDPKLALTAALVQMFVRLRLSPQHKHFHTVLKNQPALCGLF